MEGNTIEAFNETFNINEDGSLTIKANEINLYGNQELKKSDE